MKKIIVIVSILFIAGVVLTGCTSSSRTIAAPGKIITPKDVPDTKLKIVTFYVTGKGLEPEDALTKGEAVLMAERAAVADGYRKLVEKLRGVYVDAFMQSGRGTVDHELIRTQTQSWLRGTEVVEIKTGKYGITSVRMRLRIHFSKKGMVWWPAGIDNDVESVLLPS